MPSSPSTDGGLIWVTRSEPGATELATALTSRGHAVWCQPVLEVAPLEPQVPHNAIPNLVITLSGHAARGAAALGLVARANAAQHIAVGAVTAAELAQAGVTARVPEQANSEGILDMPELDALDAASLVWIWAGRGGRDVLTAELPRRYGCEVVKIELYLRQGIEVREFPQTPIKAVVVSSIDGLEAFHAAWQNAQAPVQGGYNLTVFAASERIAQRARELGYTGTIACDGVDAESICQAVDRIPR